MKQKKYLILSDEFIKYCKLNNIEDIEKHAEKVFNIGFMSEKYKDTKPKIKKNKEIINAKKLLDEPIVNVKSVSQKFDLYDE